MKRERTFVGTGSKSFVELAHMLAEWASGDERLVNIETESAEGNMHDIYVVCAVPYVAAVVKGGIAGVQDGIVADLRRQVEAVDCGQPEAYARHVYDAARDCTCSSLYAPCGGVLQGGICDGLGEGEDWEEPYVDEFDPDVQAAQDQLFDAGW